jgi:hypothetical protein
LGKYQAFCGDSFVECKITTWQPFKKIEAIRMQFDIGGAGEYKFLMPGFPSN